MSEQTLKWLKGLAESVMTGGEPRSAKVAAYPHEPPTMCRYYRFIWQLVRHMEAKRVVETGTFRAASCYTFAASDPACRVLTIDTDPNAKKLADALGCANLTAVTCDSLKALDLVKEFSPIDILFLDSDHNYDLATAEYRLLAPLVRKGGVILMDDIHLNPGMDRFWNEVPDPKVELNFLHVKGFGAALKP